MKLSEKCLRNWINLKDSIEELCNQITYSGLEVEKIEDISCKIHEVLIGKIVRIRSHPLSNNLLIMLIDIGKSKINIVCKKYNLKINMIIVVACSGVMLYNNQIVYDITIKGVKSQGKLCSFSDLNMLNMSNDIIVLPNSAPIGLKFKYYELYCDKMIKINITPNRMDAYGAFGISREIAILNNVKLSNKFYEDQHLIHSTDCKVKIQLGNIICQYYGIIIKNINLNVNTPIWMVEVLRKHDMISTNIVNDIINYVFIQLGQSIYVFSFLEYINNVIIRFARNDEMILNNTNNKIVLNHQVIVIDYNSNSLSLLGITDKNFYSVNVNHTNIFIGSFFIDPTILNNSLYQLKKINNISSNEYYVDPSIQYYTIQYVVNLFIKICGGTFRLTDSYRTKKFYNDINRKIKLYHDSICRIIGLNIDLKNICDILYQMEYKLIIQKDFFYVTPPPWRLDIRIEEDILSDIMRIYKYDQVLPIPLSVNNSQLDNEDRLQFILKRLQYTLVDIGYHEIINYSFIDPNLNRMIYSNRELLCLKNPISTEMSCMRHSLLPGLIQTLLYHQNRQHEEVKLFEHGLCFLMNSNHYLGVEQRLFLSGIIGNIQYKSHWNILNNKFDFYDMKGHVEYLFESIGYFENINFKKKLINGLDPNTSVEIYFNNDCVGIMGSLSSNILKYFSLYYSTFVFEIFLYKLNLGFFHSIKEISEFPMSKRDISVIISKDILVNDIILYCKRYFINKVVDIVITDVYQGHSIPTDKKSITLTFIFQSIKYTLKDQEINFMINYYIEFLRDKFQAILRN